MLHKSWIALVAVISVVLHASTLTRHHDAMLSAASRSSSLLADLTVICHSATDALAAADRDAPATPSEPSGTCPICLGMMPLGVIFPSLPLLVAPRIVIVTSLPADRDFLVVRHLDGRARARDPPTSQAL